LTQEERTYFQKLKSEVAAVMRHTFPGIDPGMENWKGHEITDFQEDLLLRVKGQVSEKWFYSHIKSESAALPRIDTLDLLCRYAGYKDWNDFKYRNPVEVDAGLILKRSNRYFIYVPVATIAVLVFLVIVYRSLSSREYSFSFFDTDTRAPITGCQVEAEVLSDGESPLKYVSDSLGVIRIHSGQGRIRMVIRAPYYRTDTLNRVLRKFNTSEKVGLRLDDYSAMIRFYSEGRVDDWMKRRAQLDSIFDDRALICQVHDLLGSPGMSILTKDEFIDKLTMPTGSLKRIDVLDTRFSGRRIILLRFRIKPPTGQ
jgi:hypothetical protein